MNSNLVSISIKKAGLDRALWAKPGERLVSVLVRHGLSPRRGLFQRFNCLGSGICGTCRVFVQEEGTWMERRSCQIRCFDAIQVEII